MSSHVPVLLRQAIDFLAVKPGGTYVDATVGLGGHSFEIASRLGAGSLIGFDKVPWALERARERLRSEGKEWPEVRLIHSSFATLNRHVDLSSVDGLLADLGMSSLQLADPERGFSFQADAPLDMRMDPTSGVTAEQVVNQLDEQRLADLILRIR